MTRQGARLAVESHEDVTARLETLAGELRPADSKRLVSVVAQMLAEHGAATGRVGPGPAAH